MALSGKFLADFTSFTTAVTQAELQLKGMENAGGKTGDAINRMVERFSGAKVITESLLMAEAVDRVGGVSRLTASNIRMIGSAAAESAEQMKKFGQDVPPRMQALADAFHNLENATEGQTRKSLALRDSFNQVDGALSAVGVNVGPTRKLFEDLESAIGKTAQQMGPLAVAGLAVSAAIGGWKFGRQIAEWADLDRTIGDATAKLLRWGDVAAQEAGAKADVLARATKIAGFEVTDLATAIDICRAAALRQAPAVSDAAAATDKLAQASRDANDAISLHNKQLLKNAAEEISARKRAAAEAEDAARQAAAAAKAVVPVLEEQVAEYDAIAAAASRYESSGVGAADRIMAAQAKELEAARQLNEERAKAIALNRQMGGSFDITRANFAPTARGMGLSEGLIETLLKKGYSFAQATLWANHPDWPPPESIGPRVPGFAGGVTNFRGGAAIVGERGPEMVTLPRGSNVIPNGGGGDALADINRGLGTSFTDLNQATVAAARELARLGYSTAEIETYLASLKGVTQAQEDFALSLVTHAAQTRALGASIAAAPPINNYWYVNGTAEELANRIKKTIFDQLKLHRQF